MDDIFLYCYTYIDQLNDNRSSDCADFITSLQRQFDAQVTIDNSPNRFQGMRTFQYFTSMDEQKKYPSFIKDFGKELDIATKRMADQLTILTVEVDRLNVENNGLSYQYFRLQEKLRSIKKSKSVVTK